MKQTVILFQDSDYADEWVTSDNSYFACKEIFEYFFPKIKNASRIELTGTDYERPNAVPCDFILHVIYDWLLVLPEELAEYSQEFCNEDDDPPCDYYVDLYGPANKLVSKAAGSETRIRLWLSVFVTNKK